MNNKLVIYEYMQCTSLYQIKFNHEQRKINEHRPIAYLFVHHFLKVGIESINKANLQVISSLSGDMHLFLQESCICILNKAVVNSAWR